MDVCGRIEFDFDPDLCSSDRLERGLWSSRLVSIESSVGCDLANQGDCIGGLDPCRGNDPRLFFTMRFRTHSIV